MAVSQEIKRHWLSNLRRLNHATRILANPAVINLKLNQFLAREGWMEKIIAQRFASGGGSQGASWPALKPATIRQRIRQGFSAGPILVRSGILQQAALKGKKTVTAAGITMELKDRAAPRYVGRGRARKKKTNPRAVSAKDFFGFAVGSTGKISDYAAALNRKRPFFGTPIKKELEPMLKRRAEKLSESIRVLSQGGKVSQVL